MKIALVNDDLIQRGGQELLLTALSDLYPDADIFTSIISDYWKDYYKGKGRNVITSGNQKLPFSQKISRYYSPFLLHNIAYENFNFGAYDIVLSQSSRFAHHAVTKADASHICYMNSPGRMFWEPHDYFRKESFGRLTPLRKMAMQFLELPLSYHRQLDFAAAQRVDYFIANSGVTAKRIKKYYFRDSDIIYPFVDTDKFKGIKISDNGYYSMVCRLSSWKRVDTAVEACTKLGVKLKVVGYGPEMNKLKYIAGPTVEFLGQANDKTKIEVIAGSTALIQTQREDFGIVPLEAMACGKPVIAYGFGGVLETVIKGETGIYYYQQDSESLINILKSFNPLDYSSEVCKNRAEEFRKEVYRTKISNYVSNVYNKSRDIV